MISRGRITRESRPISISLVVTDDNELKNAVKIANESIEGILINTASSNVMIGYKWVTEDEIQTYLHAIKEAENVLENEGSTVEEVSSVLETLRNASALFDESIKHGEKELPHAKNINFHGTPQIGGVVTVDFDLSDGKPAGDRMEYFVEFFESDESHEVVGSVKLENTTSNSFIIPETFTNDDGLLENVEGKYIEYIFYVKGGEGYGERFGPILSADDADILLLKETIKKAKDMVSNITVANDAAEVSEGVKWVEEYEKQYLLEAINNNAMVIIDDLQASKEDFKNGIEYLKRQISEFENAQKLGTNNELDSAVREVNEASMDNIEEILIKNANVLNLDISKFNQIVDKDRVLSAVYSLDNASASEIKTKFDYTFYLVVQDEKALKEIKESSRDEVYNNIIKNEQSLGIEALVVRLKSLNDKENVINKVMEDNQEESNNFYTVLEEAIKAQEIQEKIKLSIDDVFYYYVDTVGKDGFGCDLEIIKDSSIEKILTKDDFEVYVDGEKYDYIEDNLEKGKYVVRIEDEYEYDDFENTRVFLDIEMQALENLDDDTEIKIVWKDNLSSSIILNVDGGMIEYGEVVRELINSSKENISQKIQEHGEYLGLDLSRYDELEDKTFINNTMLNLVKKEYYKGKIIKIYNNALNIGSEESLAKLILNASDTDELYWRLKDNIETLGIANELRNLRALHKKEDEVLDKIIALEDVGLDVIKETLKSEIIKSLDLEGEVYEEYYQ